LAWIILEGLDRTGKSTVADIYKKQGFDVIHMSAPDKKYKKPGYSGPSYLDDILEVYMKYDNKDVVFDRSIYGELVWPHVYGRAVMLSDDDFEILREFEDRNQAERNLLVDPETEAHWQRCVDNNEPLTRPQFTLANRLFTKLAHNFNFMPRQLSDFKPEIAADKGKDLAPLEKVEDPQPIDTRKDNTSPSDSSTTIAVEVGKTTTIKYGKTKEQTILEKANAINSILSKRIIKQKGATYDLIESDIKDYLNCQLKVLFSGTNIEEALSKDELTVLKLYAQRILDKQKERA